MQPYQHQDSKTTFVTVNQNKDKDIEELNDYSKTTFVTVNPLDFPQISPNSFIQKQPLLLLIRKR